MFFGLFNNQGGIIINHPKSQWETNTKNIVKVE